MQIPRAGVIYFESESAITKQMVIDRGIDTKRMVIFPVTTVQEFRTQALKVLDGYLQQSESDRKPLFLCLDSLGMLSTTKEVEDTADGKETRDMTRAQVLKAAFRVLTLKARPSECSDGGYESYLREYGFVLYEGNGRR